MTKQCRYALSQIRKFTNNTASEIDFIYENNAIYMIHQPQHEIVIPKYKNEFIVLIPVLLEKGYLIKTKFGYQLTHKGMHPYGVGWETLKSFLIKSILVPVVVAFLTAALTTIVGYIWSTSVISQKANQTPSNAPIIEESTVQTTDNAD